jgi:hypothetical protein
MDQKELIEKQFQELMDKAKSLYPNLDESLATMTNIVTQNYALQSYFDLTNQVPVESANNHIPIT